MASHTSPANPLQTRIAIPAAATAARAASEAFNTFYLEQTQRLQTEATQRIEHQAKAASRALLPHIQSERREEEEVVEVEGERAGDVLVSAQLRGQGQARQHEQQQQEPAEYEDTLASEISLASSPFGYSVKPKRDPELQSFHNKQSNPDHGFGYRNGLGDNMGLGSSALRARVTEHARAKQAGAKGRKETFERYKNGTELGSSKLREVCPSIPS